MNEMKPTRKAPRPLTPADRGATILDGLVVVEADARDPSPEAVAKEWRMTPAERALIEAALYFAGCKPEDEQKAAVLLGDAADALRALGAEWVATDGTRVAYVPGADGGHIERLYRTADGREEWRVEP